MSISIYIWTSYSLLLAPHPASRSITRVNSSPPGRRWPHGWFRTDFPQWIVTIPNTLDSITPQLIINKQKGWTLLMSGKENFPWREVKLSPFKKPIGFALTKWQCRTYVPNIIWVYRRSNPPSKVYDTGVLATVCTTSHQPCPRNLPCIPSPDSGALQTHRHPSIELLLDGPCSRRVPWKLMERPVMIRVWLPKKIRRCLVWVRGIQEWQWLSSKLGEENVVSKCGRMATSFSNSFFACVHKFHPKKKWTTKGKNPCARSWKITMLQNDMGIWGYHNIINNIHYTIISSRISVIPYSLL